VAERGRRNVRQVFVLTLARSGSTLLRYLLDTHSEVTSPPELNLTALLHHAADTWHRSLDAITERPPDDTGSSGSGGPGQMEFSPEAYRRARATVDPIIVRCLQQANASVFVDKSLVTLDHLQTVARCYPRASYIFLYRYPLDMIASGIDASRWGFNAFGFGPYVSNTPGNFVGGLGNYWIDRVSRMLEFEKSCPSPHTRITYEALCGDPSGTVEHLLDFLDLTPDPDLIDKAFRRDHGRGPGDYKVDYTGGVTAESIGRGSLLPHTFFPGQADRINGLAAELGYPSLDQARHGDLMGLLGLRRSGDDDQPARRTVRLLTDVLDRGWEAARAGGDKLPPRLQIQVVTPTGGEYVLTFDPDDGVDGFPSGRPEPLRIRAVGDILLRVATGEANLAQAMHDGEVQIDFPPTDGPRPQVTKATMTALRNVLRAGATSGALAF
jgi:hypothetical protein